MVQYRHERKVPVPGRDDPNNCDQTPEARGSGGSVRLSAPTRVLVIFLLGIYPKKITQHMHEDLVFHDVCHSVI